METECSAAHTPVDCLSRILRSMRDSGSPRRSGSSESGIAAPDDDKYNKPRRPDEERLWLGMPVSVLQERVGVLAILMVFQSASGMILSRFEDMLQKHVVVTLFLTMLVGAGGNAGNQSTVNIIRGLATGQVNNSNASSVVLVEAKLGLALGVVLAMLGWARVMISDGDTVSAMAIGAPRPAPPASRLPGSPVGALQLRLITPRCVGLLHRRHLDRRRRGATYLAAPEWPRRSARRARHTGAHGYRRRVDHVLDLRPALQLFWSTLNWQHRELDDAPLGDGRCSTLPSRPCA